MERSLLYVSRARLPAGRSAAEIEAIVGVSQQRNAALGVTGSLIRSADFFAQLLEGSAEAVDMLMDSIDRDPRHTDVTVLRIDPIVQRRLVGWSMSYCGVSSYVANRIGPLVGGGLESDPPRIDRLMGLVVEFAGQ